jgi:hypothetical protein
VRLGNPNLSEAAAIGRAKLQEVAQQRAANVLPVIRELQAAGAVSHNAIAKKLNARNVTTARGRKWSHVQVAAVLARAWMHTPVRAAIINQVGGKNDRVLVGTTARPH